ncbi:MAG: TMEM43 family protein [bacterium]
MIVRERKGWFSRIGESFGGVIFGFLLFLASFALLFWNEGRAVRRAQDLEFGAENVIKANAAAVDAKLNGKLVHVAGAGTASGPAVDPELGVSGPALTMARKVEMYQWRETARTKKEKKIGGAEESVTEYSYEKTWSDKVISSSNFRQAGHDNPTSMPFNAATFNAPNIKVGAYSLSPDIIEMIAPSVALTPAPTKLPQGAKVVGKEVYLGANPQSPAVVDVKISYQIAPPGPLSVVGGQQGQGLVAYMNKDLNNPVVLLEHGTHSPEMMFKNAEDSNTFLTWALRVVGFLMMFFGLRLIGRPLSVLADLLPFLGTAVGFVTGIVSFFIAAGLSFVTIAIAWIFYRPLIGILLLVLAVGSIVGAILLARKASKKAATA